MKGVSMKVPPLGQLYQQKHDYQSHKKKLIQIMSDRKSHLLTNFKVIQLEKVSKNLLKFGQRHNAKSFQLARQNSKLVKKIENARPSLNFKQLTRESRIQRSLSLKSKVYEQQRQNNRIQSRVQSMNSSLNKKSLLKDYRKSIEIRNRLMHYKTEPSSKVVLKVNRYLDYSQHKPHNQSAILLKQCQHKETLPKLIKQDSHSKSIIQKKLGIKSKGSTAGHYKKEEVLSNKINLNNRLFKLARERRLKALTVIQKKSTIKETNAHDQTHGFFATELEKKRN